MCICSCVSTFKLGNKDKNIIIRVYIICVLLFMSLNLYITLTYSKQFIWTAQSEQMNYTFKLNHIPDKEHDIQDNYNLLTH